LSKELAVNTEQSPKMADALKAEGNKLFAAKKFKESMLVWQPGISVVSANMMQ
jgi:hypothetical protein